VARFVAKLSSSRRGLSLLEMIVVLALLAILFAMVTNGYSGFAQASAVTAGADGLRDALIEARADAISQNTPVEVRIYDLPPTPNATPAYNALQLHWLKADKTTPPISHVVSLGPWAVIDSTATHSTLIGANSQTATPDATDPRLNSQTRVFHFLPDGSTDLAAGSSWFMAVRAATQSNPAQFPSNWACVAVDPTTGRPEIYRP
jgi:uncharacterized protein (TIGR02596 family)